MIKNTLRKIIQWSMQVNVNSGQPEDAEVNLVPASSLKNMSRPKGRLTGSPNGPQIEDFNRGMNFVVYNAIGGKVIQIHSYDVNTDKSHSTLYIITDKEDLGEEIGQIITKESLSR